MRHALVRLAARIRLALLRGRVDDDAGREIDQHLELLVARYVRSGLTPDQARMAARRQFGNTLALREEIHEMNTISWLEIGWSHVRHAMRALRRRPGYAAALVATVSVGVASSTAVFGIVDTVLLRPLPFPHPHELVALWEERTHGAPAHSAMAPANIADWAREARSFSSVGLWTVDLFTVRRGDGDRLQGAFVSGDFFATLDVAAARGRTITRADERVPSQVVLSDGAWRRVFGADPTVVGSQVLLNERAFTVIGIMPATFMFPRIRLAGSVVQPDLFVPLDTTGPMMAERGAPFMLAIGRLRTGTPLAAAREEGARIAGQLRATHPSVNAGRGLAVVPLHEQVIGNVRVPLALVFSAAMLLLLIACLNTASMLIARAGERMEEVGVRLALGAGRARLLGQFIVESLVVFGLGGVIAIALATALQRVALVAGPAALPRLDEGGFSLRSLSFGLAVSLVTSILFGALPLLATIRPDAGTLLGRVHRGLTATPRRQWLRNGLIAGEVAVALVLLVGAGLMIRTLMNLDRVVLGFEPKQALTLEVSIPPASYQRHESPAVTTTLLERIGGLPGVDAAGAINVLPLSSTRFTWTFDIEDRPIPRNSPAPRVDYRVVTPGVFAAMEIPLRSGRLLSDEDVTGAPPVALVNDALARRFWPNESPLGRRIRIHGPPTEWFRWATIVGVVADVRGAAVDGAAEPAIYRPLSQHPYMDLAIVVRSRTEPLALIPMIRSQVREVDPDLTMFNTLALDTFVSRSTSLRRTIMVVVTVFAAAALFLVAVGTYGLVSTVVSVRLKEMAIRVAFGADRVAIVGTFIRSGALVVLLGVAAGTVLTTVAASTLSAVLFEVSPWDVTTHAIAAALLVVVAGVAMYAPARNVFRVSPARLLNGQ
jgi:putative ABC transport system permease protein